MAGEWGGCGSWSQASASSRAKAVAVKLIPLAGRREREVQGLRPKATRSVLDEEMPSGT